MKTNYIAPQIEVIEIEVEDVLCQSNFDLPATPNGGNAW